MDERPNLIDLNTLAGQAAQGLVLVLAERLTGILKQLGDGVLAGASEAADRAERHPFDHHPEDFGALGGGELVHEWILTLYAYRVKHEGSVCSYLKDSPSYLEPCNTSGHSDSGR